MFLVYFVYSTMNFVRGGIYKSWFHRYLDIFGIIYIVLFGIISISGIYSQFTGIIFLLFVHSYTMMKLAKIDAYIAKGGKLKYDRFVYFLIAICIVVFSLLSVDYWTSENLFLRGFIDLCAVSLIVYYRFVVLDKNYTVYSDFHVQRFW